MQTTLDRTFTALGDPARRAIVRRLAAAPATVSTLAEPFDISRPAVSRHLRVLSEAGIVKNEKSGRERWYSLNPEAFDEAEGWLEEIGETWSEALGALKTLVEEEANG